MKSDQLLVNGIRLHYLHWGSGQATIVFLHGNSHCGGVWTPLARRLSDQFSVVAMDLRGHGLSDKPEFGYDWASLRDDAAGLIMELDLQPVLLVGHSRGGGISLLVAAALRDRVKGVLVYEPTVPAGLNGTVASAVASPESITARLVERALRRRTVFSSRAELLDRYRTRDVFANWRDEFLHSYIEHGTVVMPDGSVELACPAWVEAKLYEAMFAADAWRGLYCPDLPVLAVYGGRSRRNDDDTGLTGMFPQWQTVTMPDASHFGPMEYPEHMERLIRDFAATLGLAGLS